MAAPTTGLGPLLTYAQAQERLGVSRTTLYRMLSEGTFKPVDVRRPGTRVSQMRLREADVDAYLQGVGATYALR